jgi:hypothetical protein
MGAGGSAQREYERRRANRRAGQRRLRPLVLLCIGIAFAVGAYLPVLVVLPATKFVQSVSPDFAVEPLMGPQPLLGLLMAVTVGIPFLVVPRSETAWRRGAEGERIVGRALDTLAGRGARVLHDRRIPRSRANLDHLAVTPAGVFVIDAKRYKGKLQARRRGTELWINGRNRSKLLHQAKRQAALVDGALERAGHTAIRTTPMLCFVGTKLPWLFPPRDVAGVAISTPKRLATLLVAAESHALEAGQIAAIADVLDRAFVPATPSPS